MSRFAGYALRLRLRSQVVKCVFWGGAQQQSFTRKKKKKPCCNAGKLQSKTNVALSSPTSAPIFCLIKVLLVLDSSKFTLLIDGCCLVAVETAFPLKFLIDNVVPVPLNCVPQASLNDDTRFCFKH